jgi:hypothetical protein
MQTLIHRGLALLRNHLSHLPIHTLTRSVQHLSSSDNEKPHRVLTKYNSGETDSAKSKQRTLFVSPESKDGLFITHVARELKPWVPNLHNTGSKGHASCMMSQRIMFSHSKNAHAFTRLKGAYWVHSWYLVVNTNFRVKVGTRDTSVCIACKKAASFCASTALLKMAHT